MSHSTRFAVGDDTYTIVHNGDWSGDAYVYDNSQKGLRCPEAIVVLPGELFMAVGRQIALAEVVEKVENLMTDMRGATGRQPDGNHNPIYRPTTPTQSCICVMGGDGRYAHGGCLAYHTSAAVGHIVLRKGPSLP